MTQNERRELMFGIVENQLKASDPPETKATLDRLMASGISRKEAVRLIACCVSSELFYVLRDRREFDRRYVQLLDALPAMPWDGEEEAT